MPVGVLRAVTRLNIGGPARQALLLSTALRPDYETTLAVGRPMSHEGELADPDVPTRVVPLVRPISPVNDLRALIQLRQLITDQGIEIVHTHMAKAGAVGRIAARTVRRRPKTIHTFHGHVLQGYFRPPAQRVFVETERRLARFTDVIVAISEEVKRELLGLGIGREEQYRVIRLGFDLTPFFAIEGPRGGIRAELGLPADRPLVGSVGRLVPAKDHATLFRSIAMLDGVHLAVIGDGELRSELEDLRARLGLVERIHFLGWRADMATVLADLDVVALSSRNEGTPVALIEALAAGRPVVSTDVGGVRSVVEDGSWGFLCHVGDDDGLAQAIERLLNDSTTRQEFGQRGRAHVSERFSHTRLIEDIRDLYRELLGNGANF